MKNAVKRYLKQIAWALVDCLFVILAWVLSVWFYSYLFIREPPLLLIIKQNILWLLLINVVVFWLTGMYRSMWRYSSIGSLLRVAVAVLATCFIDYVFFKFAAGYWQSPAIPVMAFFISLSLCGIVRLIPRFAVYARVFYTGKAKQNESIRQQETLVVGAGQAGSDLVLDIKRRKPMPKYDVRAYVDDDVSKHKMTMHGVEIVGGSEMIPEIVERYGIERIIIAMPSATKREIRRIMSYCPTGKCRVSIIPSFDANANNVRDIDFADLLGREEAHLDTSSIKGMVDGKNVLVTGGSGSIGSELCRQILQFDIARLIVYDIYENSTYDLLREIQASYGEDVANKMVVRIGSVQDCERLEEVFGEFKPSVIFHAAAYKHVPLMEECPRLAVENNVFGTRNVAACARKYNAQKFVMISTDKAVNPTNIMGATKRMAEKVVMSMNGMGNTEFVCVRFGNVLGSNGSVIPIFERQIKMGGPVTVTHPEIVRYFMTIQEASRLVIQAAAMAKGGEIFVLDMGEPVKIAELAENIIRLSGYIPGEEIKIEYIGLRPGEKLYEELLTAEEGITATEHEKIFIAKPTSISGVEGEKMISVLGDSIRDGRALKARIKEFVPEYKVEKTGENVADE